jgi:hypothetical protein
MITAPKVHEEWDKTSGILPALVNVPDSLCPEIISSRGKLLTRTYSYAKVVPHLPYRIPALPLLLVLYHHQDQEPIYHHRSNRISHCCDQL